MWYPKHTPRWVHSLFKGLIWNGSSDKNQIYLTIDDGPNSESTELILDTLSSLGIQATFFCVGQNIDKNPSLLQLMIDQGHQVGGHSYNHVNGWKTPFDSYIENVQKGQSMVPTRLFRPPYGKLSFRQMRYLKDREKVVMWDIIPGDFDTQQSTSDCMECIRKYTKPGSIIVLHDNPNYHQKVIEIIRQTFSWAQEEGFTFGVL